MLSTLTKQLTRSLKPSFPTSKRQRDIIFHLMMDMAWMGVLNGTVGSFLMVYAARMGATDTQVGWVNAAPAIINLILGLPAGNWMRQRSFSQIVFWSSLGGRIFYLPICLLPLFLSPAGQVQATIFIILVMSIPLTLLNVSFNSMMSEVIPPEQRGYVVGGRNALIAITSLIFTLGSGKLLVVLPQPLGYQVVFGIGFIGAMLSSLHLFWIRNISAVPSGPLSTGKEKQSALHIPLFEKIGTWFGELDRRYLRVVALLFGFHIAQWLVIPVSPLLAVNQLKLTDFQISLGGSLFSLITFIFSFQASRVIGRMGNRKAAGYAMIGLGIFPLLLALAKGLEMFLAAHLIGAVSWGILGVALLNYLLENTPARNRSVYISYYIVASNASILVGSLAGPSIASLIGYSPALALFAVLRALAGVAVLLWG